MTAYIWIAICGLLMTSIGVVGHVVTTQRVVEKTEIRHANTICVIDEKTGTLKSWKTTYSDEVDFWKRHRIVKIKDKP